MKKKIIVIASAAIIIIGILSVVIINAFNQYRKNIYCPIEMTYYCKQIYSSLSNKFGEIDQYGNSYFFVSYSKKTNKLGISADITRYLQSDKIMLEIENMLNTPYWIAKKCSVTLYISPRYDLSFYEYWEYTTAFKNGKYKFTYLHIEYPHSFLERSVKSPFIENVNFTYAIDKYKEYTPDFSILKNFPDIKELKIRKTDGDIDGNCNITPEEYDEIKSYLPKECKITQYTITEYTINDE
ncbi:MAG TPA: hypothetical protein PKI60_01555 [Oscillospiraceae bacterium]|nr:hypothetical protein [Oscillospiraceae bacterium]